MRSTRAWSALLLLGGLVAVTAVVGTPDVGGDPVVAAPSGALTGEVAEPAADRAASPGHGARRESDRVRASVESERTASRAPELAAVPSSPPRFEEALLSARQWLDAREAARRADDEQAEEEARELWEEMRAEVLAAIRGDAEAAGVFLAEIAAWPDEEAADRLAALLPFVTAEGFEDHLLRTAIREGAPELRGMAVVGLRGRGLRGAQAVERIAASAAAPSLRVLATEELGAHLADPAALTRRNRILRTVAANLEHPAAEVRVAALQALLISRDSTSDAVRRSVGEIASSDPAPEVGALARQLQRRLSARD